jgi:hypothetical protein
MTDTSREALIKELRLLETIWGGHAGGIGKQAADMLEADAEAYAQGRYDESMAQGPSAAEYAAMEAQQVAAPTGCHRSHPHEEMNEVCTLKTEIARLKAAARQAPVAYSVGRSLNWHHGRGVTDAQLYAAPVESYDQQALELCGVCGWKAVIPGEPCLNCGRGEVTKALDAYAAERDALAADAGRYRFMKSCSRVAGLDIGGRHSWTCQIMRSDIKGTTLDEAIDSAIKKAGPEPKTDWSAA